MSKKKDIKSKSIFKFLLPKHKKFQILKEKQREQMSHVRQP